MSTNKTVTLGIAKVVVNQDVAKDFDVEFICSTKSLDRSAECIDQSGWQLDRFKANPVFLACHQHRLTNGSSPVIGSFRQIAVKDGQLVGSVKFASTDLGQEYKTLYAEGHMRAVSVGFISVKGENRKDAKTGESRFTHTEMDLLEVSGVPVPANPEALRRELDDGQMQALADLVVKGVSDAIAKAKDDVLSKIDDVIAMLPDDINPNGDGEDQTPEPAGDGAGKSAGQNRAGGSNAAARQLFDSFRA